MGYNSRFELHAIHPVSLGSMTMTTFPAGYQARVRDALEQNYGSSIRVDWETGAMFGYESVKFYEYDQSMKDLSRECPQAVWVLKIDGEEQGDQRALYAYRGVTYEEKQPEWVPPPPNMKRLPSVDEDYLDIEADPPTPMEALQLALVQAGHDLDCHSRDLHASGSDGESCNCWRRKVNLAIEAQKKLTARGR